MTANSRRLLGVAIGLVLASGVMVGSAASLSLTSRAFTPYRTCTITGNVAATAAVADASVRQGAATTNFGTAATNDVTTASGANRRLYIRFDLSTCAPVIPSTATVRLATLRLYLTAVPATCRTIDLFRVTSAWTEASITWNTQPFGTTINNPASGTAVDTFTVGTPAGCQNQSAAVYSVLANPTADVAAYVAGSATNFGWMLRDDIEGSATTYTVTSTAKDGALVAQAPQLVVTYVTVP